MATSEPVCCPPANGPRGSEQAIANIRSASRPGVPAVLLANHCVLVFHRTPELAVFVGGVVEGATQAATISQTLGGSTEIRVDMREAALQRAMTFGNGWIAGGLTWRRNCPPSPDRMVRLRLSRAT